MPGYAVSDSIAKPLGFGRICDDVPPVRYAFRAASDDQDSLVSGNSVNDWCD